MKHAERFGESSQAGMALLEVLVSILLFSLGILGLIGLQARAINFSVDAEDRNRAALFANEIASAMWLSRTIAIDPASGTPSWNTRVADTSAGGLPSGAVTITGVTANSADVTIAWRPPQRAAGDNSQLTTRITLP